MSAFSLSVTQSSEQGAGGHVIFQIHSRARTSSANLAGFRPDGDPLQRITWTEFVDRAAHSVGDGVIRHIHAEKKKVETRSCRSAWTHRDSLTFAPVRLGPSFPESF